MARQLSPSMEDYLKAIYQSCAGKDEDRSKEIVKKLHVTGPSVTMDLRVLSQRDLIYHTPCQKITLTPSGKTAALDVIRRHEALRAFFTEALYLPPEVAEEGASKSEHFVPAIMVERMVCFLDFLKVMPATGNRLASGFADYLDKQGKGVFSAVKNDLDLEANTP